MITFSGEKIQSFCFILNVGEESSSVNFLCISSNHHKSHIYRNNDKITLHPGQLLLHIRVYYIVSRFKFRIPTLHLSLFIILTCGAVFGPTITYKRTIKMRISFHLQPRFILHYQDENFILFTYIT
jgi:hypothetical protein